LGQQEPLSFVRIFLKKPKCFYLQALTGHKQGTVKNPRIGVKYGC